MKEPRSKPESDKNSSTARSAAAWPCPPHTATDCRLSPVAARSCAGSSGSLMSLAVDQPAGSQHRHMTRLGLIRTVAEKLSHARPAGHPPGDGSPFARALHGRKKPIPTALRLYTRHSFVRPPSSM